MSTTRERREARAARLRGWADSREAKAETAYARTRELSDMIPLGQPILVGHHSEGRHRRDLGRIDAGMRATVEHSRKAEQMRARADNIESAADAAIYSDDPDAIERLAEKLATLEAKRDRIKAYNATTRKGKTPDPSGLTDRERADLAACQNARQAAPGGPFPGYVLSNLGATIRTTTARLARLTRERDNGGPAPRPPRPNRYAGTCTECGGTVEAGAGLLTGSRGDWTTTHNGCPQ